MELEDFKELLIAHLDPIREAVIKLERGQEQMLVIISNQAVMMNNIQHIETLVGTKIKESYDIHNVLFERMRKLEDKNEKRQWDVMKLFIASIVSWVIGGISVWIFRRH